MKPTQKQIEQAFERGIKPGSVVLTPAPEEQRDTRADLEVERESYALLKEALSIALRDHPDEVGDESLYVTQLRNQIQVLRTRLGITE